MRAEVQELLRRPWTIVGPREEDGSFIITIDELAGFVVAGDDREEVIREFVPALAAFLESYFVTGHDVPMPRALPVTQSTGPRYSAALGFDRTLAPA